MINENVLKPQHLHFNTGKTIYTIECIYDTDMLNKNNKACALMINILCSLPSTIF